MEIIFSVIASFLFLYTYVKDVKRFRQSGGRITKAPFYNFTVLTFAIVIGSVLIVNLFFKNAILAGAEVVFAFSFLLSALITRVWFLYIKWIDIYEPERNLYLGLVFILSCCSIYLVFPLTDVIQAQGFVLNGEPLNDFLYSAFTIGMVEESVKLIPLLIILFFTKQINEPIDYIVYASISALGFAFIENILYIQNTNLASLSARLLYSSVAHMFFSSIIGYALAINMLKRKKSFLLYLLIGLVIASLSHGFYDFWLINEAFYLPIITTVFYVGSLHIWVVLKNNLINNTNFYRPDISLDRNNIKYKLITHLVFTIYMGYIAYAIINGAEKANAYLAYSAISFLFLVVYISLSFSSFNIIRGYIAPVRFPVKFFLPKVDAYPDYSGIRINLLILKRKELPIKIKGKIVKRLVFKKDYNWYLFEEEDTKDQYLIKPKEYTNQFKHDVPKKVMVCDYKTRIEHTALHLDFRQVANPKKGLAFRK